MQGHLQVAVALAFAVTVAGCKDRSAGAPPAASTPATSSSGIAGPALDGGPVVAVAMAAAAAAKKDVDELDGACSETPAYLRFREHVATLAPFLRPWASASAEVLVGPERPVGEGAGAMADLDAALAAKDCNAAKEALAQAKRAVTLATVELGHAKATMERGGELVQRAAFELGLQLAEASLSTPRSPEAALADARGTLRAVHEGARALGEAAAVDESLRPIDDALRDVARLWDIPRRAALVRATGRASEAAAASIRARGFVPRGTYAIKGSPGLSALQLPPAPRGNEARIALGKRLFEDARFSKGAKRSCASCHREDRAFTDGARTPRSLDASTPIPRNTPTLSYVYAAAAQRWDGRLVAPEDQALAVLHTKAEMGVTTQEIDAVLSGDAGYREAFAKEGLPLVAASVGVALAAFVESLGDATSPLDRYAAGDDAAMTDDEHRGFDLFVGKARCARCHAPPTFGGSRAPLFQLPVYAAIGVPRAKGAKVLDPDPGRGGVTKVKADEHAFKTPTLRNAGRTAPYFHQGAFDTLAEVVDFYDRGGGKGLGLDVPNQDPDVVPLGLSPDEKRRLVTFVERSLRDRP